MTTLYAIADQAGPSGLIKIFQQPNFSYTENCIMLLLCPPTMCDCLFKYQSFSFKILMLFIVLNNEYDELKLFLTKLVNMHATINSRKRSRLLIQGNKMSQVKQGNKTTKLSSCKI